MPAVAAIGAIGAWVGSAAAGVATAVGAGSVAAGVGAVAGAVAKGVVIGAVMGAASSAISGGNILEGALRGAAIGGLTAGAFSVAGQATGMWSAADQMAGMGLSEAGSALPETAGMTSTAGTGNIVPADMSSVGGEAIVPTEQMTQVASGMGGGTGGTPVVPAAGGAATPMTAETSRIYAGMGQGTFQGLGQVGASMMEAKETKKLAEWEAKEADRLRSLNQPVEFQSHIAGITPASWWEKYTSTNAPAPRAKRGLLA